MVGKETLVIGRSTIKSVFLRPPHDIVYCILCINISFGRWCVPNLFLLLCPIPSLSATSSQLNY